MLPPFPDIHVCLPSQFKCTNTNRCIPGIFRCNGQDNCGDGEDEKDCRKWGAGKRVGDGERARFGVRSSVLHQIRGFGYRLLRWLVPGHGAFSSPLLRTGALSTVTLLLVQAIPFPNGNKTLKPHRAAS